MNERGVPYRVVIGPLPAARADGLAWLAMIIVDARDGTELVADLEAAPTQVGAHAKAEGLDARWRDGLNEAAIDDARTFLDRHGWPGGSR